MTAASGSTAEPPLKDPRASRETSSPDPLVPVIGFFEGLRADDLDRIGEIYAPQAWFKDPFNEVRGQAAIRKVFEHMFATLDTPRFRIVEHMRQDDQAFVTWDFEFRFRHGRPKGLQCIRGGSHLHFCADGRIESHRDYWDAADLYGTLPVLGVLMRWLKTRIGIPTL